MTYGLPNFNIDPVYAAARRFDSTTNFRDVLNSPKPRSRGNVTIVPEPGQTLLLGTDQKVNNNGLRFALDEECDIARPGNPVADYQHEAEFGARIDMNNPSALAAHVLDKADKTLSHDVAVRILGGAHTINRGPVLQLGIGLS